jgi:hypothetical protein
MILGLPARPVLVWSYSETSSCGLFTPTAYLNLVTGGIPTVRNPYPYMTLTIVTGTASGLLDVLLHLAVIYRLVLVPEGILRCTATIVLVVVGAVVLVAPLQNVSA